MAENYVIETTVEIDAEAYDDPMDALTYVNDLLNEGDDVLSVDTTMKEEPSD